MGFKLAGYYGLNEGKHAEKYADRLRGVGLMLKYKKLKRLPARGRNPS